MDTSIIMLTLNAGAELKKILEAIDRQESDGEIEVIVIDSGSTDNTLEIAKKFSRVSIHTIDKFTHGGARNLGVRHSKYQYLVYLTQDAIPVGKNWLKNLLKNFSDPLVAATFSRQIPKENAPPMERYFLSTHFPLQKTVRWLNKRKSLTIYDVFFSNVSSAIRKDILLEFPFDSALIMSEDQQFAKDILLAGYKTIYEPTSVVYHSHNYSLKVVFQRYFDSLYSLSKILNQPLSEIINIGSKYTFNEYKFIFKNHPKWIPRLILYDFLKVSGSLCGKYADIFPNFLRKKMSLHKYYWK